MLCLLQTTHLCAHRGTHWAIAAALGHGHVAVEFGMMRQIPCAVEFTVEFAVQLPYIACDICHAKPLWRSYCSSFEPKDSRLHL
jgi:hypothetical protein